jgi:hypothetical protein
MYVPIPSMRSLHQIEKVAPKIDTEQIGTGEPEEIGRGEDHQSTPQPQKVDPKIDNKLDPDSSNKKRKLDTPILESFLHPKLIKTKTIKLKSEEHNNESHKKQKIVSHKFSVV